MDLPPQLRQQFFGHVMGPIIHHSIKTGLPKAQDAANIVLGGPVQFHRRFNRLFEGTLDTPQIALETIVDGVRLLNLDAAPRVTLQSEFPLTEKQFQLRRFFLDKQQKFPFKQPNKGYEVKNEGIFTSQMNGLYRALLYVGLNIDGLEVSTLEDLKSLAKRPDLRNVLSPIMAGGPSFDLILQFGRNVDGVPGVAKFAEDKRPVAFLQNGILVPNPEVLELARQFNRQYNSAIPEMEDGVLSGYASGCPVRFLLFRQHTQLLDQAGAGLTDDQLAILLEGADPTAGIYRNSRNGGDDQPKSYIILRDAITEMLELAVCQLDDIELRLMRALDEDADTEFLADNLTMLVGGDFQIPINDSSSLMRQGLGKQR